MVQLQKPQLALPKHSGTKLLALCPCRKAMVVLFLLSRRAEQLIMVDKALLYICIMLGQYDLDADCSLQALL